MPQRAIPVAAAASRCGQLRCAIDHHPQRIVILAEIGIFYDLLEVGRCTNDPTLILKRRN
jgi:hypothetical protein